MSDAAPEAFRLVSVEASSDGRSADECFLEQLQTVKAAMEAHLDRHHVEYAAGDALPDGLQPAIEALQARIQWLNRNFEDEMADVEVPHHHVGGPVFHLAVPEGVDASDGASFCGKMRPHKFLPEYEFVTSPAPVKAAFLTEADVRKRLECANGLFEKSGAQAKAFKDLQAAHPGVSMGACDPHWAMPRYYCFCDGDVNCSPELHAVEIYIQRVQHSLSRGASHMRNFREAVEQRKEQEREEQEERKEGGGNGKRKRGASDDDEKDRGSKAKPQWALKEEE